MSLIFQRRSFPIFSIDGIAEGQEMLGFCGERNITVAVEVTSIQKDNKRENKYE